MAMAVSLYIRGDTSDQRSIPAAKTFEKVEFHRNN